MGKIALQLCKLFTARENEDLKPSLNKSSAGNRERAEFGQLSK
jgi:hypothetical protein